MLILRIVGGVILALGVWGWAGFMIVLKYNRPFQKATPLQFYILTVVGLVLVFTGQWFVLLAGVVSFLLCSYVVLRYLRTPHGGGIGE